MSWDEAIAETVKLVKNAKAKGKTAGAVGVPSPRSTNEELYVFKKLLETMGATDAGCGVNGSTVDPEQMEDGILRRKNKTPNSTGVVEIGLGPSNGGVDLNAAFQGVMEGSFKAIYLLGPGVLGSGAPENLAREALGTPRS